MRTLSFAAILAVLATAACVPASETAPDAQVTKARPAAPAAEEPALPAMGFLANPDFAALPQGAGRGNAALARDFLDLAFQLESGRALPILSRFEGPVTVAMTGAVPASAPADLSHLIARLRSEAGIDIRPAAPGEPAAITVHFAPRAQLRRLAPSAACFVVPNVSTPEDYRASRGTATVDWAAVVERRQAGIFVPAEASPQEVRDCLNEELAQALGPLNDLYRLTDSVFNDDNFHSVLTRFDMTILRAYYAPELRSGMSRKAVAAALPAVLDRINPGGAGMGGGDVSDTPKSWKTAIETALGAGGGQAARRAAADRALMIARAQGWTDGRLAFSHFAIARLYVASDRTRAVEEFSRAAKIYRSLPGAEVQVAHIDMQLAAIAVASGQPEQALAFADRAIPVVRGAQNYALLATVQLIKAEALDLLGRSAEADALRMDSRRWAGYGFGSDAQVRARTREIAALGAQGSRG
ncbi:DUF2927 domain-containing protein [Rhodobacter sp. SGA-6-6]|uniref:DUF2927 domain-containing protein n=1 Tax=Rhodobacter sp. SGA-6-6 TaxID=2710882 RepID=UPI0013EC7484|nr:DUF2927 domain-containing protein [Rhodobacter sp. SGA-6-6]NGM46671.1 DUF2927 domain-containing protein [Rhodobacter sp. SGA-6-6]